ncbi:MAG: type ISP restriction/modification enzyme, partial [Trichodesmium sp.]
MQHFLAGENLGLITTRQQSQPGNWHLFGVTENIIESCAISNKTKEINYLFPLYLYPDTPGEKQLGIGRRPNLAPEFLQDFSKRLKMKFITDSKSDKKQTFGAEDIFNYIYAIFHSPTYRSRYSEFLKIDFPHIPLTSNPKLFFQLIKIGDRLVNLHLMKITTSEISSYPEVGNNRVENISYTPSQDQTAGKVWINKTQYFAGVPLEVWNFNIGSYQVCQKWLKDRKNRELNYHELTHYQNIIAAIWETIFLMKKVDEIIDNSGGFPIQ